MPACVISTFWEVDDKPVAQESHGQALEQQCSLAACALATQYPPYRLLLLCARRVFHLLEQAGKLDGFLSHQHGRAAEQTPSLVWLECINGPQRIHDVFLGKPHDFSLVLLAEHICLVEILERRDVQCVVVAEDDALAERLPLSLAGPLARVASWRRLALFCVQRLDALLGRRRHALLLDYGGMACGGCGKAGDSSLRPQQAG